MQVIVITVVGIRGGVVVKNNVRGFDKGTMRLPHRAARLTIDRILYL